MHGSTPILRCAVNLFVLALPRLQLLCAPRAFRNDLSLVLCLFPYSSHSLHILSVHMASCCSSTLTTLSSMSPYPQIITILQLPNSSFVSRPSMPGSAITVSIEPRQIRGNRVWHYPALTFSSNDLYCQCRRNPCPGFQSDQDSWRYSRQ